MKRELLVMCAAVLIGGTALAAEPLASFFGNTLIVKDAKGERKMWYKPDHTFNGSAPGGRTFAGTWSVKGDQLCSIRTEPAPEPGHGEWCRPLPGDKKPGDTWEGKNRQGEPVTFSLMAGQQ